MPKQWVYITLILFVLFLIWSDPGNAGQTARTFAGWLGTLASAIFDFLEVLVGGGEPNNNNGGAGGGNGGNPPSTVGGGIDDFNSNPAGN